MTELPELAEDQALAIVNEAKAASLDLRPGTTMEQAEWLLRHAREDWERGVHGDLVKRFMVMGGLLDGGDSETIDDIGDTDAGAQETTSELGPTRESPTLGMVAKHRLPVPREIEGDPPEMPRDLTEVDDRTVRKLHSEFNAWLNRTMYLIGVEKADQQYAELLLGQAKRRALLATDKVDQVTGKTKLAGVLSAEVESDPEVAKWDARLAEHEANLHMLHTLKEIYSGNVDRLAKDWKMRRDQFDMAGGA